MSARAAALALLAAALLALAGGLLGRRLRDGEHGRRRRPRRGRLRRASSPTSPRTSPATASRSRSLVPRGTDPHAFEPTPSDLGEVAGADLVIVNGGGLEGPLLDDPRERRRRRDDRRRLRRPAEPHAASPASPPLGRRRDRPALLARPRARQDLRAQHPRRVQRGRPGRSRRPTRPTPPPTTPELDALDAWIKEQVAQVPQARPQAGHGPRQPRLLRRPLRLHASSARSSRAPRPASRRPRRQLSDLTATIREHGRQGHLRGGRREPAAGRADRRRDRRHGRHRPARPLADARRTAPAPTYIDMMKYDTRRIVEALRVSAATAAAAACLTLDDVTVAYGGRPALDDVTHERAARRPGGHRGPQRRRQVDAVQGARRPAARCAPGA